MIFCRNRNNKGLLTCTFLNVECLLKSIDKKINDIDYINIENYLNNSLNEINSNLTTLKEMKKVFKYIVEKNYGFIDIIEIWKTSNESWYNFIIFDYNKDFSNYCITVNFKNKE